MSPTRLASLAAVLVALSAAPALAQAPGDCACAVPVVTVEAPRKIGVSLRMSALGVHPEEDPEMHTDLSGAGLAVSYRINRRWGLGVAVDHFTERLEDGTPGRELGAASLSATFHILPRARWDAYLLAGLGVAGEGETTQYGTVHVGAGLERRFRRLGLSGELRMIGLSESEREEPATGARPVYNMEVEPRRLSGAQLTLAGTYYF